LIAGPVIAPNFLRMACRGHVNASDGGVCAVCIAEVCARETARQPSYVDMGFMSRNDIED